jgi:hypothetical protein
MSYQKILRTSYVEFLASRLNSGDYSVYYSAKFEPDAKSILIRQDINDPGEIKLKKPNVFGYHEYENAVSIFNAYKDLTREQASDGRFWAYLSHVKFRDYMAHKRLPTESEEENSKKSQILQHWFVYPLNAKNLLRNDIAFLWWGAYLTYDKDRADPFELTRELFSMADYTRTLLPSVQGRNNIFTKALLEYVVKNKSLFSKYKEGKVRKLMEKMNFQGGHMILTNSTKKELFEMFDKYRPILEKVSSR